MGTLASLDNVFYPPGGIGYIMSDLADLNQFGESA